MRCANGFAIGNGRTTGVLGTGTPGPESGGSLVNDDDEADEGKELVDEDDGRDWGVVSMMLSSEVSSDDGGISSFGRGGIGGSASRGGRDAAGEGGGSTKALVRKLGDGGGGAAMLVLNSGICREGEGGMAGMVGGITSVSYAGWTFCFARGESATPSPEERRETRVFRALATTDLRLRGDLRGEAGGSIAAGTELGFGEDAAPAGAGVGGSSASIISTSHDRFSSRNFNRSAYAIIRLAMGSALERTTIPPMQLSLSQVLQPPQ